MFAVLICLLISYCILKRYILSNICLKDRHLKPVFITGCDTGFGRELALKLVENNVITFAGCFTENGKRELEKDAQHAPGKLLTIPLDVTNESSMREAVEIVKRNLNDMTLWGVVCNAGIASAQAPDDWLNVEDYKIAVEVNTFGVIRTCHAFKPMIKRSKGRIVITSSAFGRLAMQNAGPYVLSKFAVEAYADVLRLEGKVFGYTVHILEPGFHKTGINNVTIKKAFENVWNRLDEKTRIEYGSDYFEKGKESIDRICYLLTSTKTYEVINVYNKALFSRFPSSRYRIGFDSKYIFCPLAMFPTGVQDFLMGIEKRIRNLSRPQACKKN